MICNFSLNILTVPAFIESNLLFLHWAILIAKYCVDRYLGSATVKALRISKSQFFPSGAKVLHSFLQQSLNLGSAKVWILHAPWQRFAKVRTSERLSQIHQPTSPWNNSSSSSPSSSSSSSSSSKISVSFCFAVMKSRAKQWKSIMINSEHLLCTFLICIESIECSKNFTLVSR